MNTASLENRTNSSRNGIPSPRRIDIGETFAGFERENKIKRNVRNTIYAVLFVGLFALATAYIPLLDDPNYATTPYFQGNIPYNYSTTNNN